jgi:hypothetical protein
MALGLYLEFASGNMRTRRAKKIMKTKSKTLVARRATAKSYGRLFESDKLMDQELDFISEGTDEAGQDYDFFLTKTSRSPVVKSRTTGRCFILPWPELIKLGVKAGLNKLAKQP